MTTAVTNVGDTTFLADYLINAKLYAVVVPPGGDPEFVATFEVNGDQGTLTMAAIIGPRGPQGIDMFALSLQTDAIDDPADLPSLTLQDTVADKGKLWVFDDVDGQGNIIGSSGYIWYGTAFRRIMMGTPGPPGPVPVITPDAEVIPYPGNSVVVPGGTAAFPTQLFKLAVPPGPQGPGAALALAPDVDLTTNPPNTGDILGFTGRFTNNTLLPAPSSLLGLVVGSGTLPAGDYSYVVTAVNSVGETTASNRVDVTLPSTGSVELSWGVVGSPPAVIDGTTYEFGAATYNVYRVSDGMLVGTVTNPTVAFTDDGSVAGTAGSPPVSNTAAVQYPIWVPVSISQLIPSPFSMPENAFTSYTGLSTRAPVGSYALPPQPFPWTAVVWGHCGAHGLEISTSPLTVGAEVRLGDANAGALIGRGFGNTLGEVNIMPHYSWPSAPAVAINPDNNLAVVPANHTNPAQGTVYVNMANDGALGLYIFNPTDAQLFVLVIPVSPVSASQIGP